MDNNIRLEFYFAQFIHANYACLASSCVVKLCFLIRNFVVLHLVRDLN